MTIERYVFKNSFTNSGHGLLETQYDRFQDVVINKILPRMNDKGK